MFQRIPAGAALFPFIRGWHRALAWLHPLLLLAVAAALAGCGGGVGFNPVVTAVKAQSAQYGRSAVILIGGRDLRSTFTVDTQGGCTTPGFAAGSSTETLVLNCRVAKVGEIPLSIFGADGALLFKTSITVPNPQVVFSTSGGALTVELDPVAAPVTVDNFLSYVNSGYYKDTLFHRVIAGFVAQGGGYTSGMVEKPGRLAPIVLESNKGLSNLRGTVAMARTSVPDSATSEFYVNLVDNTFLDYRSAASPGYAVFGKVVQGLNVIDAMATQPTGVVGGFGDVPLADITITLALQVQ